jgi:hypothetical protein
MGDEAYEQPPYSGAQPLMRKPGKPLKAKDVESPAMPPMS